jgi:hypothetical protein
MTLRQPRMVESQSHIYKSIQTIPELLFGTGIGEVSQTEVLPLCSYYGLIRRVAVIQFVVVPCACVEGKAVTI